MSTHPTQIRLGSRWIVRCECMQLAGRSTIIRVLWPVAPSDGLEYPELALAALIAGPNRYSSLTHAGPEVRVPLPSKNQNVEL